MILKKHLWKVTKKNYWMNHKILTSILLFVFIIVITSAFASEQEDIDSGQRLIQSKTPCNNLNDQQLESIGEYFMEQMHPGELHELMDARMGGEGSETLKQIHINIARMMYCGERNVMPVNMMNTMMNRGGYFGMMGFGNGFGNMMGYNYYAYGGFIMIFWIIILILIIYILFRVFNNQGFNFGSDSLEILKKRYAKGEISKKEFDQMKKELH